MRPVQAAEVDDRWRGENGERVYDQNDVIGAVGIEVAMETELRGERGRQNIERDAMGANARDTGFNKGTHARQECLVDH